MFWTFSLSIIRSFSPYTQQWYMSYRFADSLQFRSDPARKLSAQPVWHIPLLCVRWKTPDNGQRNCPKHVEFHSKNKFEKFLHLVGFIIRIYHDARSPERQKSCFKDIINIIQELGSNKIYTTLGSWTQFFKKLRRQHCNHFMPNSMKERKWTA